MHEGKLMATYNIKLNISNDTTSGTPVYPPKQDDAEYSYVYLEEPSGKPIYHTIPLMHKSEIKITVVDSTGRGFEPFACMVNAAGGGGMVHYFMPDMEGQDVQVVQSVPHCSRVFENEAMVKPSPSSSPHWVVSLGVNSKIVPIMKNVGLTVFVKCLAIDDPDDPEKNKPAVIIACDPEFDSDRRE
jgi:hypothetical protein